MGIQKPGRLNWRNRSARTPKNRDKTNFGVSQALLSVGFTPPGCDWPLDLNRQPAGACTGTTPSTLILYAIYSLKSRKIGPILCSPLPKNLILKIPLVPALFIRSHRAPHLRTPILSRARHGLTVISSATARRMVGSAAARGGDHIPPPQEESCGTVRRAIGLGKAKKLLPRHSRRAEASP